MVIFNSLRRFWCAALFFAIYRKEHLSGYRHLCELRRLIVSCMRLMAKSAGENLLISKQGNWMRKELLRKGEGASRGVGVSKWSPSPKSISSGISSTSL